VDEGAHGGCVPVFWQAGVRRGCFGAYFHERYALLSFIRRGKKLTDLTDPVLRDHFWINPFAKHFSLMKASDLVLVDSEGYVCEGGNQTIINEAGFMIHSEIHKARPDVVAAAHTHGIYGKTWSAFGKPIEMITQGSLK
jgi:ribulose-5-phosphate 4-epimerase/fuculose-1-phosphate aldolase